MTNFDGISGFQWDKGNISKNWEKHRVSFSECEEIFFNQPLIVADDEKHSGEEKRFFALGKTDRGKRLFLVFTFRNDQIRVISPRSMNRKEEDIYEKRENSDS
ncbi:MAG: BrnT family toxin [Chlorobiaceae bacterium]|nr:BrnT family toxin [Chlorobiaceae bacterium]